MHRVIALIVMLGAGWSQLSALACPMGDPAGAPAGAVPAAAAHPAAAHAHHVGDSVDEPVTDEKPSEEGGSSHSGGACALLTACAGAALAGDGGSTAPGLAPLRGEPRVRRDLTQSTVFPTQDPPPPRLPV